MVSGETSVIPSKNLLPTRKVSADKFYLASSSSYSHTHIPTNFHINKFDNFEVQLKIYKFNPISEGGAELSHLWKVAFEIQRGID